MICLMILFINMLIMSITGHGFAEEPVLLAVTGCLEVIIVLVAITIYRAIKEED